MGRKPASQVVTVYALGLWTEEPMGFVRKAGILAKVDVSEGYLRAAWFRRVWDGFKTSSVGERLVKHAEFIRPVQICRLRFSAYVDLNF